jgi:SAM-dependent methyltransferase
MTSTGESGAARPPDYGIDAPRVVTILAIIALAGTVLAVVFAVLRPGPDALTGAFIAAGVAILLTCGVEAFLMVRSSRRGKQRLWKGLIRALRLQGDEHVLDVGCGRGLVLCAVAKLLTTGRAVGVDVWRSADMSGNSASAARENAVREGVADRVEIREADMRELPFADASFDVVLASLAIHNIDSRAGRAAAIAEIARVLRPGGRVVIADIQRTDEYVVGLTTSGCEDVHRSGPSWQMFPPVRVVTALRCR